MVNDRKDRRHSGDFPKEEKQFEEQVIHIDRVARVVKGGRRFRFRALVVVGDGKHQVGVGVSKGGDVQAAVSKAVDVAKKNLLKVPAYRESIPHQTSGKQGGAHVLIMPAAPGTGIIAGGTMRTILETAGIKNVLGKSLGSSNKVNTAYATIAALKTLKPSKDWVTTKTNSKEAKAKEKKTVEA
jgi:small subunit ribosomal protein S5